MEQEKLDWDALRTVTDEVLRYKPSRRASASRSTPPKEEPAEEEKPDEDSSEHAQSTI